MIEVNNESDSADVRAQMDRAKSSEITDLTTSPSAAQQTRGKSMYNARNMRKRFSDGDDE